MLHRSLILLFIFPYLISTEPIELTDKTWREMLNGQWMAEFYAPWCPACRQFKKVWSDFSNEMLSKNVKVAALDVDQYPSLSGRFRISALPTVFYIRDGVFRQYEGERSLRALKAYIENEEWQNTQPMSSSFAPDSLSMSLLSSLVDLSMLLKDAYSVFLDDYGWPTWLIYIVFGLAIIFLGIMIGFISLMIVDYCIHIWYRFFRKHKKPSVNPAKQQSDESSSVTQNEDNQTVDSEENTSEDEENTSDIVGDSEVQTTTTDQNIRKRRVKN